MPQRNNKELKQTTTNAGTLSGELLLDDDEIGIVTPGNIFTLKFKYNKIPTWAKAVALGALVLWVIFLIWCGVIQNRVNTGAFDKGEYMNQDFSTGKNLLTSFWFFNMIPVVNYVLGTAAIVKMT